MRPIVSLCIPTNGIKEWVIPVIDSIYDEALNEDLFEIIVEDNGEDVSFENIINDYKSKHSNLFYYKSEAKGFLCQIDSFKHANGRLVKFVNHRFKLVEGALEYLIKFATENEKNEPVVFFSNGNVKKSVCVSFDDFVLKMGYWSSWSGGLAFWNEDIRLIDQIKDYNVFFPHTNVLFLKKSAEEYIIDDKKIFEELDESHASKGKYNLFQAFAYEYLTIISDLYRQGFTSLETLLHIKKQLLEFLANLYIKFIIKKEKASYSFDDYFEYILIYYSKTQFFISVIRTMIKKALNKIIK